MTLEGAKKRHTGEVAEMLLELREGAGISEREREGDDIQGRLEKERAIC